MKKRYTVLTLFSLLGGWLNAQTISTFPYNENFESLATCGTGYNPTCALGNGWTNVTGDNSNWAVDINGTTSSPTGPTANGGADHNPGIAGGKYVYFEASGGTTGHIANLVSPYFNLTALTAPQLKFWYHMYGASMGNMHVDVHVGVNGVWALDVVPFWTDNIDMWQEKVISLSAYAGIDSVQFRIRGERGNNFYSDMAVDDFTVKQKPAYDYSAIYLNMPSPGCGLGLETAVLGIVNEGSATISSGLTVLVNYTDGTNIDQDTILLGAPWAPGDTLVHNFTLLDFSVFGTYNAKAWVNDSVNHANDTVTSVLISKPEVSVFPYFENFESGNGGWVANNGANGTWALGTPAATVINAPAPGGTNSWATNLTGNYNNSDNSYVESPCFDFTLNCRPEIELDIWWDCEFSWDGAVLQSSIDGGVTWQNVGALGDPDFWYTDNSIAGNPGGQQIGWSGNNAGGTGSGGWVTAKHELTGLGGLSGVILRIAYGSDGSVNSYNGVAFDNIRITETPPVDLATMYVTMPTGGCGLGLETVTAGFYNRGCSTLPAGDTLFVFYDDGTTSIADTVVLTVPLAFGDTVIVNFTNVDFSVPATYNANVWVMDQGTNNGNDTLSGTLVSKPTITTFPYYENFESGNGGWTATNGANGTWALGTPAGAVINSAASGSNAWVTNLTGFYNDNDNSYVESPCFDLSNICNPVVELDIWWDAETSWDGAVLQSSTDGGTTWQNVGGLGNPYNWFNDGTISGNPGGQQVGWSGDGTSGSGGWVTARHQLNGLDSLPNVILRIAFGSDGIFSTWDGFAFDNVRVMDFQTNLADAAYICTGDSLQLVVTNGFAGSTVLWSTGATSPSIWVDTAGWYSVSVTSVGCTTMDSTYADVIDTLISIDLGADTSLCGGFMELNAGAITGATYVWNTGDSVQGISVYNTGTYIVSAMTVCASTADTIDVIINTVPIVIMNDYNYDTICLLDGAIPLPAVFPSGGTYYGPGVTGGTFLPSAAGVGNIMTVYEYTDGNGCAASDTAYIIVDACAGLNEITSAWNANVYPNPNNGSFQLNIANANFNDLQIRVMNALGQEVYNRKIYVNNTTVNETINLNDHTPGVYFMNLITGEQTLTYRVTVK